MPRVTITLPEPIHQQVLKIATKEKDSLSYTIARLVEIGLIVLKNKNEGRKTQTNELEEYCQKLIIQINGVLKALVINQYNFDKEIILKITKETLDQFNRLKTS
ncbi:hypothetical protein A6J40_02090 [Legionella longbeachae]|uniref:hypothetical protein n=1 Tax=Legionella longbeachae TaxID=450 RepID=UPI0009B75B05|nr:hypothetical protein [Legionella longbeachae]VEE02688.1 Uncharacterised protein [Legionella oakridgensis]ARB91047.1 hypothetical protein A6J40_02090 [Legionella longbeachae]ARM32526.1 hypothetical protein B0B39_02820 [Legionella longbeachae]RZV25025.1 hypothetical protein EKG34_08180 [Legionella longbeachae]UAK45753.1 hypothetical protein K8O86_13275 [Legionella longbeachae]